MTLVLHQSIAVLPVFLVKFMTGVNIGWVAPMLHQLKTSRLETAFTSQDCAWIAALHYLTRGFSPFLSFFIVDRLGRNFIFKCSSVICFIVWIAIYMSKVAYVHYAVRMVFGVGVGILETAISIYIGENCSSELRGVFSGVTGAFFYLGEVMAFVMVAYLSYEWVAICSGVMGLIAILSTVLLKEPAHYLIEKGKLDKAEINYHYLHDLRKGKTKLEYEDIKKYVREQQKRKASAFSSLDYQSAEICKSLRIVVLTNFLCVGCGFSAINSFVTIALARSQSSSFNELTILFGLCQLVSVSVSSIFLDTFNRRTLFISTGVVISFIHGVTAILCYVNTTTAIPAFNLILFILLTSFSCVNAMFTFPLTAALQGELLPQSVKALGSSLGVFSSSLSGFLGAKIFLPIADSFGLYVNFILFAVISLIMVLYAYFDLPETKGKTLVDIQRELRGFKSEKAHPSEEENCL